MSSALHFPCTQYYTLTRFYSIFQRFTLIQQTLISTWRAQGYYPHYPLGCDFNREEQALAHSLRELKALQNEPVQMLKASITALLNDVDDAEAAPYLERIGLAHPKTAKNKILQHLLLLELEDNGYLKAL